MVIVDEQEETLKGVEDGEDIVGCYTQRPVAEESKGPGDAKQEEQAYNGVRVSLDGADVLAFPCCGFEKNNLPHSYDEYAKGEDEHYSIITDIHHLMDNSIRDPAHFC